MSELSRPATKAVVKPHCEGANPEIFFPVNKNLSGEALAYCELCPFKRECRLVAIRLRVRYGVWAGVYLRERTMLQQEALNRGHEKQQRGTL